LPRTTEDHGTRPSARRRHLSSKPDGWPAGGYQVEILLDGATVPTDSFSVTAPQP
jgi:hypothetical protein